MPIDFQSASYSRQYRDEQGDFRRLSILTKAIAAYLRNLVDPVHGWLRLHGDSIAVAFSKHAAGSLTQSDRRLLVRCAGELLAEGYLVRCHVVEAEAAPSTFATHDQRDVPVSPWREDPAGDWVVISNWVPAQNGLSRDETIAWHTARRERCAAAVSSRQPVPALVPADARPAAVEALAQGLAEVRR